MTKRFEYGNTEFVIPAKVKEHYTEEEFEEKMEMYDANDYEVGRGALVRKIRSRKESKNKKDSAEIDDGMDFIETPFEEDNTKKEVSKETEAKIVKFRKKINKHMHNFMNDIKLAA